ncbi:MAG: hypothetical protein KJ587_02765 [Alphaproteobacteria bacterium]|nr:hypothetical protein [Alphaproteobacteria bacterium]
MTKKDEFGLSASGVATKAELEARIAARPKPRAELHLTPQGWEVAQVNGQINKDAERRIRALRQSLDQARHRLETGHGKALIRGKAKHAFDRGR